MNLKMIVSMSFGFVAHAYVNLKMIISMMIGFYFFIMGIADDLVHLCKFENDCFDDDR